MPLEGEVTLSKLTNGSLQRIERGREETPTVFCLDFLGRLVVVESVTLPARCDLLLFVATFSSQTASELYTLLLVLLPRTNRKEKGKVWLDQESVTWGTMLWPLSFSLWMNMQSSRGRHSQTCILQWQQRRVKRRNLFLKNVLEKLSLTNQFICLSHLCHHRKTRVLRRRPRYDCRSLTAN